jgi:hypothetical protein
MSRQYILLILIGTCWYEDGTVKSRIDYSSTSTNLEFQPFKVPTYALPVFTRNQRYLMVIDRWQVRTGTASVVNLLPQKKIISLLGKVSILVYYLPRIGPRSATGYFPVALVDI